MDFLIAGRSSETTVRALFSALYELIEELSDEERERAEMFFTRWGGLVMMPHSTAIAWAVRAKSPVTWIILVHINAVGIGMNTMKMRMPAPLKMRTTSGISSRGGSMIPTMPTKVKSDLA